MSIKTIEKIMDIFNSKRLFLFRPVEVILWRVWVKRIQNELFS